jgi:rare lipoprotein A
VTNLENGRSIIVRVNDRGPFAQEGERIIDLSAGAAKRLGFFKKGTARVLVESLPVKMARD